eukprot:TRINITY_DN1154_c0_g1_i11.p2 TRINITY_DN1154_c0_g1~~TRINITY_DN1154_c0_g1_i11.p2  ORF type:complete len:136 (-),score=17.54 TRINITY_DN1154_c0_g1_i11:251-658(-)
MCIRDRYQRRVHGDPIPNSFRSEKEGSHHHKKMAYKSIIFLAFLIAAVYCDGSCKYKHTREECLADRDCCYLGVAGYPTCLDFQIISKTTRQVLQRESTLKTACNDVKEYLPSFGIKTSSGRMTSCECSTSHLQG